MPDKTEPGKTVPAICATGTNYLGPFRDISSEADQLRGVSDRLEGLAASYPDVDELLGVSGTIRSIATALDIFTVVRSKAIASEDGVILSSTNGYLN